MTALFKMGKSEDKNKKINLEAYSIQNIDACIVSKYFLEKNNDH